MNISFENPTGDGDPAEVFYVECALLILRALSDIGHENVASLDEIIKELKRTKDGCSFVCFKVAKKLNTKPDHISQLLGERIKEILQKESSSEKQ